MGAKSKFEDWADHCIRHVFCAVVVCSVIVQNEPANPHVVEHVYPSPPMTPTRSQGLAVTTSATTSAETFSVGFYKADT